jgi:hypothetical protein
VLWVLVVGGAAALVVGFVLTVSIQAACSLVAVLVVVSLQVHDRRAGLTALLVLWFVAPFLRRVFGLMTGYVGSDPLSVAPFVATAAVAGLELVRVAVPTELRRILVVAAAGFTIGLPAGMVVEPRAAAYAFVAYVAGVSALVLGFVESGERDGGTLRRVLLYVVPVIAAYAVAQRILPLPRWDQSWLDATDYSSIGVAGEDHKIRVFGTLNGPGALAPVLALSLLAYLSIQRARWIVVAGAVVIAVALSMTLVRSTWVALIAAALAHVVVSRGRSARLVFGAGAVAVAATLALSPVSSTANDVLKRFNTLGGYKTDRSATDRSTTFTQTFPKAVGAPFGHGLGSAGEPSKLISDDARLRTPDNGYLSLLYQVGPIGFTLVAIAIGLVMRAAWNGARARAPGQELRQMLFALLVFLIVQLTGGDELYGVTGIVFWLVAGHVLADEHRRRLLAEGSRAHVTPAREQLVTS